MSPAAQQILVNTFGQGKEMELLTYGRAPKSIALKVLTILRSMRNTMNAYTEHWTLPPFLACSGPALPIAQAQTIAFQGFKGSQLTCMFGKLFQKIVSIPVLWNIAHK